MALVRLQKFLSECGVASRRKAEELITAGKVRVNEQVITELGTKIDPDRDVVRVRNRTVRAAPKGILLFHKPRGVMSTLDDPEGRRTVADYLTRHYESYFPVGRLDYDSTGLIILTNDGELAERLTHPRFGLDRVYHVRVEGRVSGAQLETLKKGVTLEDGPARASEASIIEHGDNSTWIEMVVREGRNRLVRRMMDAIGHPVIKLVRMTHGPFKLGTIRPGDMKKLSEREYVYFRRKVFGGELPRDGAARAQRRSPLRGEREKRNVQRSAEGDYGASKRGRFERSSGSDSGGGDTGTEYRRGARSRFFKGNADTRAAQDRPARRGGERWPARGRPSPRRRRGSRRDR